MREKGGDDDVKPVLDHPTPDFWECPGGFIEFFASSGIAIDDAFDATEDVFEKDGVRAGPATPKPAKEGGEEEKGKAHSCDAEEEDPEILRGEGDAEEVEFPLENVDEHCGGIIDGDPGKDDVDDEEEDGENTPRDHESAGDISRVQHVMGSVIVDGGHTVEIWVLDGSHGGNMPIWA